HTRSYGDWSSDVCSSDLRAWVACLVVLIGEDGKASDPGAVQPDGTYSIAKSPVGTVKVSFDNPPPPESRTSSGGKLPANDPEAKIGRASCRERGESSVAG